jgi:Suppressor of fused protein (SUFU)
MSAEENSTEGGEPGGISPGDPILIEQFGAHCDLHFGESHEALHEIVSPLIHVDVHTIPASPRHKHVTMYTTGMAERPMSVPDYAADRRYAELMVRLPPRWPLDWKSLRAPEFFWPVRTLKGLARYPHDEKTWLAEGHTVPILPPGASPKKEHPFSAVMLITPLGAPEEAQSCLLGDGRRVWIYSLLFLFPDEIEFKLAKGAHALIDHFAARGVSDVADPGRKSVIKKRFGLS